jgi:hypothetical protein
MLESKFFIFHRFFYSECVTVLLNQKSISIEKLRIPRLRVIKHLKNGMGVRGVSGSVNPFIFIKKNRRDILLTVFTDLKHMN